MKDKKVLFELPKGEIVGFYYSEHTIYVPVYVLKDGENGERREIRVFPYKETKSLDT